MGLTIGRRFSNNNGLSLVYNRGKVQLSAGAGFYVYNSHSYAMDKTSIFSESEKLYTNDVKLDYNMKYLFGNLGLLYEVSTHQSLGFNTRFIQYHHNHNIDLRSIDHYTNGINDFHDKGQNTSKNTPTQWMTNLFYTLSLGKTSVDITNDFLLGQQRNDMHYTEINKSEVLTNNISHYVMNSFVADMKTQICDRLSLNYGGELTFSQHKQTFDFEKKYISTEITGSGNKNNQLLGAVFTSLNASLGKFQFSTGLRYEHADWKHFGGKDLKEMQVRAYNNIFPSMNVSFSTHEKINISVGYRQTISRPNYGQLNDNIQYQSRYYYVQGNSMLAPAITNAVNWLTSYKNLRLIGSLNFIKNEMAMLRSVYGKDGDIVFSKASNISNYMRWNTGINWWQRFGIYTPYLELGFGGQNFSYNYMDVIRHFNRPFINFKMHNTLNFKNNLTINLFVDYYGKNYYLFREETETWHTEFSVSKNIGSFFLQLSINNMFCPNTRTSTTYSNRINDTTYQDNDRRNVSLLVSYVFNYKKNKRNIKTKTSEMNRF